MKFSSSLIPGKLVRRYKRFLADVELLSGETVTAHCANTGSMLGCAEIGSDVLLSKSDNPKRKLSFSWELVRVKNTWVGIHTGRTNQIVKEALEERAIPELNGFQQLRQEVRYGKKSRIDFLLEYASKSCYLEVKNVTLARGETAFFPDAVTERGTRHLNELAAMLEEGHRAVMFYLINREDCVDFAPEPNIDPLYAKTLRQVTEKGVEVIAYQAQVRKDGIQVAKQIPFKF